MHLVYRTMENEPVPTSLPSSLIPPSKRKKIPGALPGAVAVLPAVSGFMGGSVPHKESLRSTPPPNSAPLISTNTVNLSPKHSFKSSSAVCCLTLHNLLFARVCVVYLGVIWHSDSIQRHAGKALIILNLNYGCHFSLTLEHGLLGYGCLTPHYYI